MKVSLLMLTHNAPRYVFRSIVSLKKTNFSNYELIVFDNNSHNITKCIILLLYIFGYIDKVRFSNENTLFAKGNNLASKLSDEDTSHYLLINSDIKVINKNWLKTLSMIHPEEGGISSFGVVTSEPIRADGYCMMIDKKLYDKYMLDEDYQWWWSVTKLESQILSVGNKIVAVKNHNNFIIHYGGASGKTYINAKGMDTDIETVNKWFDNKKTNVTIIESLN